MNLFVADSLSDGLRYHPDPPVIHHFQSGFQLFRGKLAEIVAEHAVHMLLQGADGFHQRALEVVADAHDFAGGLHLGGESAFCRDEFIERKSGNLHHAVVQGGLEAGVGLPGDGVLDFIQGIAQRDLRRHFGNRVPRGLGGQSGGTAHSGVHLDDAVFEAGGMEGELHIAAAGDFQLIDDVQRGGAQHLVLLVAQCLGRCHHDAVPGVHAHRVDVLHVADRDAVARAVPHDLVLDFLPARDAALHQHLAHPGKPQAVLQDFLQLQLVVGDAPAGTAQGVGGPQHHRIADGLRELDALLHGLYHLGGRTGLPDALHQILELLTSLRIADGGSSGAQKGHAVGCQKTGFLQFHPQVQPRLAPQGWQDAVRLLFFDDLLQGFYRQGLDVDLVRDVPVRHDGGGVGVHQDDLHALLLQGAAGLGARVVEFRRLADDDRAGADYHDSFYIRILRHGTRPLSQMLFLFCRQNLYCLSDLFVCFFVPPHFLPGLAPCSAASPDPPPLRSVVSFG